ncbi:hypothetical protein SK128_004094, partial [Halocaridina rubra]
MSCPSILFQSPCHVYIDPLGYSEVILTHRGYECSAIYLTNGRKYKQMVEDGQNYGECQIKAAKIKDSHANLVLIDS